MKRKALRSPPQRTSHQQHRVAVRWRRRHPLVGDGTAGPCAVFHHYLLTQHVGQFLRNESRRGVGPATSRESDNHPDGLGWIRLCEYGVDREAISSSDAVTDQYEPYFRHVHRFSPLSNSTFRQ